MVINLEDSGEDELRDRLDGPRTQQLPPSGGRRQLECGAEQVNHSAFKIRNHYNERSWPTLTQPNRGLC